jgi:hypothetical protein
VVDVVKVEGWTSKQIGGRWRDVKVTDYYRVVRFLSAGEQVVRFQTNHDLPDARVGDSVRIL